MAIGYRLSAVGEMHGRSFTSARFYFNAYQRRSRQFAPLCFAFGYQVSVKERLVVVRFTYNLHKVLTGC